MTTISDEEIKIKFYNENEKLSSKKNLLLFSYQFIIYKF